jgi:hypothetical protein
MPGLVPGIHVSPGHGDIVPLANARATRGSIVLAKAFPKRMDGRVKPGHDQMR